MNLKKITNFDFILFFSSLLLSIFGILFVYSSGVNSDGVLITNEYLKQTLWVSTGFVLLIALVFFDLRKIAHRTSILFVIGVIVLIYTQRFGRVVNYAKSWIGIGSVGIQPSEFFKIIFILYLSHFFDKTKNSLSDFKRFLISVLILLIPVFLILMQPDLGTATVFFPIFLLISFIAGIPLRYLGMVFCTAMLTVILAILPLWETNILKKTIPAIQILTNHKITFLLFLSFGIITILAMIGKVIFKRNYYYWIAYIFGITSISLLGGYAADKVLKEYQIMRLIVFLDPNIDPLASGWNIIQSMTAIGSGGLMGMGFLKGTQSHYRFLPMQSTDFIFSILSEEWGFVGGLMIFVLNFLILYRTFKIIKKSENLFFNYTAAGIFALFFYHFIVNIGMAMGIMPVTGIPLLLVSYGGSATWTALISIGILIGINLRHLEH